MSNNKTFIIHCQGLFEEWQQQISHFIIGSLNVPSASNSYLIEWKNHLKMWENVVTPYLYMYSTASPNSYLERKENLIPFFRIRWFDRVRLPIDSIFPIGWNGQFFHNHFLRYVPNMHFSNN